MDKATKIRQQLDHLQALDLSAMGYQAQIRHKQQIEELRGLCDSPSTAGQDELAPGAPEGPTTPPPESQD